MVNQPTSNAASDFITLGTERKFYGVEGAGATLELRQDVAQCPVS